MGNAESKEKENEHRTAAQGSPAVARHSARKNQTLSHATAQLQTTPHTPSLIRTTSATSATTTSLRAHDTATATLTPASSHTLTAHARPGSSLTPIPNDSAASQLLGSATIMGSEQSKTAAHKPVAKLPTITGTSAPLADTSSSSGDADKTSTHDQSSAARPVDVPQPPPTHHHNDYDHSFSATSPDVASPTYGLPPSNYSRPPRLPLPIEEEVHAPGSPIISPQDFSSPIGSGEVDGLPRRASVLSSTTADDDEAADNEAYFADGSVSAPAVPTKIEWTGPGEKIFVTGTFVNWDRKFKLQRSKDRPGHFSATLQLKPGTHHIKFLVDNDMLTSNEMPTTVDYTNILVNYIEVVAPLPGESAQAQPSSPVPGTAASLGQSAGTADNLSKPLDLRPAPGTPDSVTKSTTSPSSKPVQIPSTSSPKSRPTPSSPSTATAQTGVPLPKKSLPPATYTTTIPQFLLDLDAYPGPPSERCQRVVSTLPTPPTLPLFLGKSILNGTTPHKDDASVLIMPNHTVLNHLATSSIKGGVLATSATTRYKRKFLTSIIYRPTTIHE